MWYVLENVDKSLFFYLLVLEAVATHHNCYNDGFNIFKKYGISSSLEKSC
jgi:hypothetical protein